MKSLMWKIVCSCLMLFAVSCAKEKPRIKAQKGGMDIITNIYFNASRSLDSVKSYQVSKLNYLGSEIIELVPDLNIPTIINEVFFIKDSLYYSLNEVENTKSVILGNIVIKENELSVYKKQSGVVFYKGEVPQYAERKELNDTILFSKNYKRFEIKTPTHFSRYYIHPTDTILPYSFNRKIENDYHGRLERIDSYDKANDVFVSVQLIPRNKWDKQAKDIFEFNQYVQKKYNNKNK